MKKGAASLVIFMLIIVFSHCQKSFEGPLYKNPKLSPEQRADDLLSRMTIDEKIGQMAQVDRRYLESIDDIRDYGFGSLLSGGGSAPEPNEASKWLEMVNEFKAKALETRLAIPLIYGIDAVHGHNNVVGAVIFPHNVGLGCSRNARLVEAAARATAVEVAATGIDWTFAPCMAVGRDERWGRTYESFSEATAVVAELGTAAVRGYQGSNLAAVGTILACAKHYVGDGGTSFGTGYDFQNMIDRGDTRVDEETLRAVHLPPYLRAIEEQVGSIMASYSLWNGEYMHRHKYLLTDVLKAELGFDGFIISDWEGIDKVTDDYREAIRLGINAGIDMVMVPDVYKDFIAKLKELVEQGLVPAERIDDAVRRILRVKFRLGLFERPLADEALLDKVGCEEHRRIARECVQQSLVLLKNDNNLLPLPRTGVKIAVVGEHANDIGLQCGGWTIAWAGGRGNITQGTTILQGIKQTADDSTDIYYSPKADNIRDADIIVAVLGEEPYSEGLGDRVDLSLPQESKTLLNACFKWDKPVVAVLISGRPMLVTQEIKGCDAFVAAWLPGTEGAGVVDVLFGIVPPKGKLSFTWPASMEHIPINVGDARYEPLFPFGFGLSY